MKKSNFQTRIWVALFSLYYYKQYIADGFWMVDVLLIDPEYPTKKA